VAGFGMLDGFALAFFILAWFAYHHAVEHTRLGATSLNALMNKKRAIWLHQALQRENRIIDTQVLNGLQNGTAFFASTSLIALGGTVTLLRSTDELLQVFADLPLSLPSTRGAMELKIIGLAVLFAYAFFKFSWAYRIFNYAAILLGAMAPVGRKDDPAAMAEATVAGQMNTVAGRHFNHGQRAFFFAVAYLGWFAGPIVFCITTAAVLTVMWRRQFRSDARQALM
jgi:uncharacterized membrane protein